MQSVRTIEWVGDADGFLRLIDQTVLPATLEYRDCRTVEDVWEAIRMLRVARIGAVKAKTAAINTLRAMLITAPDALRSQLHGLSAAQLVAACARLRPDLANLADPVQAGKVALRSLAIRAQQLELETRTLQKQLDQLTAEVAPATSAVFGLGPDTVSALLVTIGDNPDRLRSEAAFAHLCGVAPIPASSGKTNRHRLHRGGDRAGNSALHIATIVRLRYDPRSRAYADRRTGQGLSMPEIIRCQKRYLAREVFQALLNDYTKLST